VRTLSGNQFFMHGVGVFDYASIPNVITTQVHMCPHQTWPYLTLAPKPSPISNPVPGPSSKPTPYTPTPLHPYTPTPLHP
jgi:hypothetical protein